MVTSKTAEIRRAAKIIGGIVREKSHTGGLVCLRAAGGTLRVAADNLDQWVEIEVPCDDGELEATVGAADLKRAIDACAGEDADLSVDGSALTVKSSGSRVANTRLGLVQSDLQGILESRADADGVPVQVVGAEIFTGIKTVRHAVAKQAVQFSMTGIEISCKEGKLTMAATDTHRLSVYETLYVDGAECSAVIPLSGALLLADIAGDAEMAEMVVGAKEVIVKYRGARAGTVCINGRFPRWRQIIPADIAGQAVIDSAAICEAIKSVNPFADGMERAVTFDLTGESVVISAARTDGTKAVVSIPMTSPQFSASCTGEYLLDGFSSIPGTATMSWTKDQRGPFLLHGRLGSVEIKNVIMPLARMDQ